MKDSGPRCMSLICRRRLNDDPSVVLKTGESGETMP